MRTYVILQSEAGGQGKSTLARSLGYLWGRGVFRQDFAILDVDERLGVYPAAVPVVAAPSAPTVEERIASALEVLADEVPDLVVVNLPGATASLLDESAVRDVRDVMCGIAGSARWIATTLVASSPGTRWSEHVLRGPWARDADTSVVIVSGHNGLTVDEVRHLVDDDVLLLEVPSWRSGLRRRQQVISELYDTGLVRGGLTGQLMLHSWFSTLTEALRPLLELLGEVATREQIAAMAPGAPGVAYGDDGLATSLPAVVFGGLPVVMPGTVPYMVGDDAEVREQSLRPVV